uniref:Secreted protein n=2 Tax=Aegilops tauschii subsp. strangulata TaxID=200361 RepID=A0A453R0K3_AEGTS
LISSNFLEVMWCFQLFLLWCFCDTAVCRGCSYYGGPDLMCEWCGAFYWFHEGSVHHAGTTARRPVYTGCCRGAKVRFTMWGQLLWTVCCDLMEMHLLIDLCV